MTVKKNLSIKREKMLLDHVNNMQIIHSLKGYDQQSKHLFDHEQEE